MARFQSAYGPPEYVTKRIGIIGAMEEEVEGIRQMLDWPCDMERSGLRFTSGSLGGLQVVVVHSGVGKVNAAMCAQCLIDSYLITQIINTGVAGSLDARLDIGDIVLSTDVLHHDMDVTGCGCAPGQIPRMDTLSFLADQDMVSMAEMSCRIANPDIAVYRGRILSGDQFISSDEQKRRIRDMFGGLCAEMEGAAIAQVAYQNKVPFLIIRAISDKADGSAEMDYTKFEMAAIEHTIRLLVHYAKNQRR